MQKSWGRLGGMSFPNATVAGGRVQDPISNKLPEEQPVVPPKSTVLGRPRRAPGLPSFPCLGRPQRAPGLPGLPCLGRPRRAPGLPGFPCLGPDGALPPVGGNSFSTCSSSLDSGIPGHSPSETMKMRMLEKCDLVHSSPLLNKPAMHQGQSPRTGPLSRGTPAKRPRDGTPASTPS